MAATSSPPALAPPPAEQAERERRSEVRRVSRVLAGPLVVVLLVLLVFPFLFNVYLSLTNWQPNLGDWWDAGWVGLHNYGDVFTDGRLWSAILRTVAILVACLALEGLIGLVLALCFMRPFRGRAILMALFLVPMMVLPVVNGFIFFMLFQSDGPINSLLGISTQWLGGSFTALVAIVAADVYQWTPLMFLILLAGILAVPPNLRSAATVLGASRWQELRCVILPLIKPVIVIALIIRGIEVFKIFDTVYIMTGGGPGSSTESVSVYLYDLGFRDFRLGYAAAVALVVLVLLAVVGMRAVKFLEERAEVAA
jgi:multiple sugar transport system permease protein